MKGEKSIMDQEMFLSLYRHSIAHVLAKAVIEIYGKENVQYAIGPQISDGCYYDFVLPRAVTEEDNQEKRGLEKRGDRKSRRSRNVQGSEVQDRDH